MVMSGFRFGSCMSNLRTKSVMNIITALIKGENKNNIFLYKNKTIFAQSFINQNPFLEYIFTN